jgi:hypothetical protein
MRTNRRFLQRFLYARAYQCLNCEHLILQVYPSLARVGATVLAASGQIERSALKYWAMLRTD